MASELHVIAVDPPTGDVVADTVARLDHLEACWSRFRPTSDVSRMNQVGLAGGGPLTVDPSTLVLLAAMVDGHQRTAGAYDPTVLPSVLAEGYVVSHEDPTSVCVLDDVSAWSPVALFDLVVDPATATVEVPAGLVLDPGGVGKGLAADLVAAELVAAGCAGALVGIGGDLATAGSPPDVLWPVDVEHPDRSEGVLCSIEVSGGGVATSSTRSRRWWHDGTERHHQIDPVTGRCSTTDLAAVTVVAPSGWLAEVHATAALAAGSADVIGYLEGHDLTGIAVVESGSGPEVLATADLRGLDVVAAVAAIGRAS